MAIKYVIRGGILVAIDDGTGTALDYGRIVMVESYIAGFALANKEPSERSSKTYLELDLTGDIRVFTYAADGVQRSQVAIRQPMLFTRADEASGNLLMLTNNQLKRITISQGLSSNNFQTDTETKRWSPLTLGRVIANESYKTGGSNIPVIARYLAGAPTDKAEYAGEAILSRDAKPSIYYGDDEGNIIPGSGGYKPLLGIRSRGNKRRLMLFDEDNTFQYFNTVPSYLSSTGTVISTNMLAEIRTARDLTLSQLGAAGERSWIVNMTDERIKLSAANLRNTADVPTPVVYIYPEAAIELWRYSSTSGTRWRYREMRGVFGREAPIVEDFTISTSVITEEGVQAVTLTVDYGEY